MKKRLIKLFLALCFIIPCSLFFVSCGDKEAQALTVSFSVNTELVSGDMSYDEETKTISWVFNPGINFDDSYFLVAGTNAEGESQYMPKASETSLGYKIETDIPTDKNYVPAGTYTYKLYCEASDNGKVKFDACEATWNIVVSKKTVDCAKFVWTNNVGGDAVYSPEFEYSVSIKSSLDGDNFSSVEGISNFAYDQTSEISAINAGQHTARVNFDLDTDNYNHINVPDKTYNWTIAKADPKDYLSFEEFWGDIENGHTVEYNPNFPCSVYSQKTTTWRHPAGFGFTGNFAGTSTTNMPGTYTVTPIFTEQEDTTNWLAYDPDDYKLTWTITKRALAISGVTWNYSGPYDYMENTNREVTLVGVPEELQQYIVYANNSSYDAGNFNATATINYPTEFYTITGETEYELDWVINKLDLDPAFVGIIFGVEYDELIDRTTTVGQIDICVFSKSLSEFAVDYVIKDSLGQEVSKVESTDYTYNLTAGTYTVELTYTLIADNLKKNFTTENLPKSFTITVTEPVSE